jgi:hypothetical protein
MRRAGTMLIVLTSIYCSFAWAKKDKPLPNWKTAKVLDSATAKTLADSQTTGTGVAASSMNFPTVNEKQLMLLGNEFSYLIEDTRMSGPTSAIGVAARAISNKHHGCHFIVNDNIMFWQEKTTLHVLDADGKECKVEVLRQERLKPSAPSLPQ